MPPSKESQLKSKFAKVFEHKDWKLFKSTAEYYFKRSALLKNSDIGVEGDRNRLLIRNIQKRLFLGIGGELLLKAFFLKEGYIINKVEKPHGGSFHLVGSVPVADIIDDNSFSFGDLIDNFHRVKTFTHRTNIHNALIILKVFRNKEGHVVSPAHIFEASVYREIETGLQLFYQEAFSEDLSIYISMKPRERGEFKIK